MKTEPAHVSYREAVRRWESALHNAGVVGPLGSETVATRDASGRVPAAPIRTQYPSPAFAVAAMDGYAVRAAATARAAEDAPVGLQIGVGAQPIDTGAALPPGCDAVVPIEDARRSGDDVLVRSPVDSCEHVRLPGEELPPGVVIGWPGTPLRPIDCAALLATGVDRVAVVRKVRVGVIPTGDELRAQGAVPVPGTTFESNSAMIAAELAACGATVSVRGIVADDDDALLSELRKVCAANDVVAIVGGSSRGGRDRCLKALETLGKVIVAGVRTRPGRPVNLALIERVPVVNLPGYPVATHLALQLYLKPVVRRLAGLDDDEDLALLQPDGLTAEAGIDRWQASTLCAQQNSARLTTLLEEETGFYKTLQADALVHIPSGSAEQPSATALRPFAGMRRPLLFGVYDPLVEILANRLGYRCRWGSSAAALKAVAAGECEVACVSEDGHPMTASDNGNHALPSLRLGWRLEGLAVQKQRTRLPNPDGEPAPADGYWSNAALVVAGLAPAARTSAYVARCFGLALEAATPVAVHLVSERAGQKEWVDRARGLLHELCTDKAEFGWSEIED